MPAAPVSLLAIYTLDIMDGSLQDVIKLTSRRGGRVISVLRIVGARAAPGGIMEAAKKSARSVDLPLVVAACQSRTGGRLFFPSPPAAAASADATSLLFARRSRASKERN